MESLHLSSFEELDILVQRGLLPKESDASEAQPMAEVRRIDFGSDLVNVAHRLEFVETAAMRDQHKKIVEFVAGKSIDELMERSEFLEFGQLLGKYQQAIDEGGTSESEVVAFITHIMTTALFHELGWDNETQERMLEGLELAENLDVEVETFYELLGRQLIFHPDYQKLFGHWKAESTTNFAEADFAHDLFEAGLAETDPGTTYAEILEVGTAIFQSSYGLL